MIPALEESPVLHYAVVFLVIALIAAVLGFGGIAGEADAVAKLLSFVFATLSASAFMIDLLRKFQAPAHPQQERTPT
jgi:uncharacterized membrane protein YtjA (UPF0391 family)